MDFEAWSGAADSKMWIIVIVVIVIAVLAGLTLATRRGRAPAAYGGAEHKLRPAGRPAHVHFADLDAAGDGTSTADGTPAHRHAIERTIDVGLASGKPADHVHDLTDSIVDV